MYRSVRGEVPDRDYVVPLGKAAVTHPGSQVTVVAYGLMAHYALEAAERVAEDGISVEVVDLRTLRPLDRETVLDSVKKTGKCLIVYEDNKFGGYGAEVAAIVAEEAFDYLDGPGHPHRRPRGPGRAVQPRARGLVHGQPREDRRRDPDARGLLTQGARSGASFEYQGDGLADRHPPATLGVLGDLGLAAAAHSPLPADPRFG